MPQHNLRKRFCIILNLNTLYNNTIDSKHSETNEAAEMVITIVKSIKYAIAYTQSWNLFFFLILTLQNYAP